jgi:hypothetical protein
MAVTRAQHARHKPNAALLELTLCPFRSKAERSGLSALEERREPTCVVQNRKMDRERDNGHCTEKEWKANRGADDTPDSTLVHFRSSLAEPRRVNVSKDMSDQSDDEKDA